MKRIASFAVAVGFVLVAAMVAAAQAPEPPETKTPGPTAIKDRGQAAAHGAKRFTGQRLRDGSEKRPRPFVLLHADGVAMARGGNNVDVRIQKGIIQAASSSAVTLKSPDGYTQRYTIDEETHVRGKGTSSSAGDLKPGEMAHVMALKKGEGYAARVIRVSEPGPHLKQRLTSP